MSLLKFDIPIQTPLLETFLEVDQAILDALPIGVLRVRRPMARSYGLTTSYRALGPGAKTPRSHAAVLRRVPG
jgi:hypothetical protein